MAFVFGHTVNKGRVLTPEIRAKISVRLKGIPKPVLTPRTIDPEVEAVRRAKISAAMKGNKRGWKHGLSAANELIRGSIEYQQWRKKVLDRDDCVCQACGKRGGELNIDHVMPFAYFPDLRFEVLNGRTLCVPCHKKTDTYGNRTNPF